MADDISTGHITVGSNRAYLARPQDDGGAGMLLLPMLSGIGEQLREFAHDIARAGITALSWDPFDGVNSDNAESEQLRALMGQLDDEKSLGEQQELLTYMFGELGLAKVGTIGWCLGGRYVFLLGGRDDRLANVVAYHPTVTTPPAANHTLDAVEYAGRIAAPVMMHYPGQDRIVPRESFDNLSKALNSRENGISIVHNYPQAEHGFSESHRHDKEVNATAYKISWPETIEFIKATAK